MLRPYLKVWDWDLIFGCAVKVISSPGVRSPCIFPSIRMGKRKAPHNIAIHVPNLHFGQMNSRIASLFLDNKTSFMKHL